MSKLTIIVTLLLVFSRIPRSWANPTNDMPEAPEQNEPWVRQPLDDDFSIVQSKPRSGPTPILDAHYYSYQQALTLRLGESGADQVIGFQYLFPKFLSPKLEAGADVHSTGNGHVHAGARWFYNDREYFRPSLKVGLDNFIASNEGLATFTHLDNFYLRATATLEYVVWNPYSIRLEAELLFGTMRTISVGTLGLSRGW